ncbi:hypothetical protein [Paenibacillus sp. FSL M7-1046]|uniref:hypothetical protein n=1 Tax=Paenibacillus sp. FSL M7-1046 TaxID=2975315 RepID=UPI0030F6A7AF
MSLSVYLQFQERFEGVDVQKYKVMQMEEELNTEFFNWAEDYFTREKRELIIQSCIDKQLPEWRINELRLSHTNWEESKENITKAVVLLFASMESRNIDYVKEKESISQRCLDFFSWGGDA